MSPCCIISLLDTTLNFETRRFAMLVLTRKVGEQLIINDNIIVTVVAIEGNKIRLGVTAPRYIPVDRGEIHERKLEEQACEPVLA
jgi:carbon storage regulator